MIYGKMKSSVDKLPDMLKLLSKKECSPNRIAQEIGSDVRTVHKLLDASSSIGIVACKSVEIEGRTYQACGLTQEFKDIFNKRRQKKWIKKY